MIRHTVLISLLFCGALWGQSATPASNVNNNQAATQPAPAAKPVGVSTSRYRPNRPPKRAQLFYTLDWGVDSMTAKSVESGELIRFSYRILDPVKAALLNDGKVEPALYGERSHVKLVIPSLEKVGQLRNKNTPEAGKSYWMAFSNKGGYVKKGDRVTVVIGQFHATGLIVQ